MAIAASTKKHDAGRVPGPFNVPSVIEVKMQLTLPNGRNMLHTVHGAYTTQPSNMQNLATALFGSLSAAWQSNLATYMHTGTIFQNVQVRDMSNFTNPVYIGTGTAVPGSAAGAAMPESMAIVMTENIAARGRGAKGRVYLGGWAQSADVTTGGISPTVQAAVNAFGTAVAGALNGQSLTPAVAQPPRGQYMGYTGTVHPARPAGHANVTSYVCRDLVWDAQRRRVAA